MSNSNHLPQQNSTNLEPYTFDYWYATSQEFRDSLRKAEERFNDLLAQDMLNTQTEKDVVYD